LKFAPSARGLPAFVVILKLAQLTAWHLKIPARYLILSGPKFDLRRKRLDVVEVPLQRNGIREPMPSP